MRIGNESGKGIGGRIGAVCLLGLLVLQGGCIFEPRDPEPPTSGESIPYLTPTEMVNAWDNMQLALRYTDAYGWESSIYERTFRYYPDSETEAAFPNVFDNWGYEQEKNFINGLFDAGVTIEAELTNSDFVVPDDSGASSVLWQGVTYFVQVTTKTDNSTTKYRATADITFQLDGSFWYISEWRDTARQPDPDDQSGQNLPSLGVLRGNYASKKSFDMLK